MPIGGPEPPVPEPPEMTSVSAWIVLGEKIALRPGRALQDAVPKRTARLS